MQASPYEEILNSRPFKFMVGKAQKEFFLHSALVASKSEVLGKMMNGSFIEGQQGYATLPDEDASTFAAFAEFAFTGDYQITMALDTSPRKAESSILYNRNDQKWSRPSNDDWKKFVQSIEYGFEAKTADAPELNEGNMRVDFSAFFIAHAKVYIFADCYGVAGLLSLAMRKLHKALCGFRLSTLRIGDIVSLTVPREAEDDGGVVLGNDYGFTRYGHRGEVFSKIPDEEEGFCSGHGLVYGVSVEELLKISLPKGGRGYTHSCGVLPMHLLPQLPAALPAPHMDRDGDAISTETDFAAQIATIVMNSSF
ncbi:hypothetical protein E4U57_004681 [Claviceps arundinis]|uniref:BTB domain-containing protein n=1 Tax=Claviceps arundinis TaxID=1623583 RepID=A0ABQ7P4I9_9HYPO|nr:hypothetical protein E4U57_004681 [Claviceps arundinis]